MIRQNRVRAPHIPRISLNAKGKKFIRKALLVAMPVAAISGFIISVGMPAAKTIICKKNTNASQISTAETLYTASVTTTFNTKHIFNNKDALLLVIRNVDGFRGLAECSVKVDPQQKGRPPITCDANFLIGKKEIATSFDITNTKDDYLGIIATRQTTAKLRIAIDTKANKVLNTLGNAILVPAP